MSGLREEIGGVAFSGNLEQVYRSNLWLRTASRVVVRIAEFEARAFHELERLARKVPWEEIVSAKAVVRFRVTCRKSRLYHSDGVAQRLSESVLRRVAGVRTLVAGPDVDEGDDSTGQLFTVRLFHDRCTISADTSGALLHRRGYRLASGKAPLRETLGAAMVLGSGWSPPQSLMDPLCGSGTLPIEAAMLARGIAPGLNRDFAFTQWPGFDSTQWNLLLDEARSTQRASAGASIVGSDRDAGVIASATENASRAGVANDVEFQVRPVSALAPAGKAGWVLMNPPYGVRVGESTGLRDLYAQTGNTLRLKFGGWRAGFLSGDRKLEGQLKLPLVPVFETSNGGIPVRFLVADV
jgi:putative N6-adenine-specific DNA methylase